MSADRWSVCPTCGKTESAVRAERAAAIEAAYGIVPRAEWEAIVSHATDPIPDDRTFREDWDIGVDEDGIVRISYAGYCARCGARCEFKHDHAVAAGHQREDSTK
jgi:hypothetical protein